MLARFLNSCQVYWQWWNSPAQILIHSHGYSQFSVCLEDFLWKTDQLIRNIDITSSTCQEDNVIIDYLKIMIVQME